MRKDWIRLVALSGIALCSAAAHAQAVSETARNVTVARLETSAASEPLGIDDATPRLQWTLESDTRGVMQQAFRVLVASTPELLLEDRADVWDSGEVRSSDPWVTYAGPPLASRTRYHWAVRVWTARGEATGWSQPAWFETALLDPDAWQGAWIAGPERSMKCLSPEEGVADDALIRIETLGWTSLGEFWEATSRSRNHHFFGTLVQWMYEDLAGMRPLEPGYERIAFKPATPAGLDRASASYESVGGTVAASWRRAETGLEVDVTVPANATGLVYIPAPGREAVREIGGGEDTAAERAESVRLVGVQGDHVVYEVGSGSYRFRVRTGG